VCGLCVVYVCVCVCGVYEVSVCAFLSMRYLGKGCLCVFCVCVCCVCVVCVCVYFI